MEMYLIDFDGISTRKQAHEAIKAALGLPDYYGKNLDALFDCLTELPACRIVIKNIGCLGERAEGFMQTFLDAQAQRSDEFTVESE